MRVCIPTTDDTGHKASLSDHFGRAPFYTVLETDSGAADAVENKSDHFGGDKQPPVFIADLDVDAVIVRELGERSKTVFDERGIDVYRATAETVRDLLAAFERGKLAEVGTDDVHPSGHHDA